MRLLDYGARLTNIGTILHCVPFTILPTGEYQRPDEWLLRAFFVLLLGISFNVRGELLICSCRQTTASALWAENGLTIPPTIHSQRCTRRRRLCKLEPALALPCADMRPEPFFHFRTALDEERGIGPVATIDIML